MPVNATYRLADVQAAHSALRELAHHHGADLRLEAGRGELSCRTILGKVKAAIVFLETDVRVVVWAPWLVSSSRILSWLDAEFAKVGGQRL